MPRDLLWKALEKKGVRVAYIKAIQDMYKGVTTNVRACGKVTKDFPISIGLHQGSALSPYLFNLVVDVLTEPIKEEIPKCMLFADDIVLLAESKKEINSKLEIWRQTLELKGLRLSRSKTEYMHCNFSKRQGQGEMEVKLEGQVIPQVTKFRYLGSIIQQDVVSHRIQPGWYKWKKATGVICDRKVPNKVKEKFYRTAIRPTMLYGSECWAVKGQHEHKMEVAEMRMLRWICGHTRKDRIRNTRIGEQVGVACIEEKMVESRLRWFGHVQRRPLNTPVRKVDQIIWSPVNRGRERPKRTLNEVIKRDLLINNIFSDMIFDRAQWRRAIHVADPT